MKVKIRLDTFGQAKEFSEVVSGIPNKVLITDNSGLAVNAKSLLGALHAMEFSELWCTCEKDIYSTIEKFVVIE